MAQAFASPGKYIQGYDELSRIKKHIGHLGGSFFVLASAGRLADLQATIRASFKDSDTPLVFEKFGGECSKPETERLRELVKANKCDVIVGMGGGKVMDTAKAVAYYEKLPVVIVPTVASSDAPTSAMVIYYTEDGTFQEVLLTRRNPNVVLVDTRIIANAPVRMLVAGMGDALATFFEAPAPAWKTTAAITPAAPSPSRPSPWPRPATRPCWPTDRQPCWQSATRW